MKKLFLVFVLFITFISNAQEESQPIQNKNEVYINAFNLVAFKWFDVSYEYLINEESSVGISLLASLDEESLGYDSYRKYAITPYYRHFFSNSYAKGFFIEAFSMINAGDYYLWSYDEYDSYNESEVKYTDMAFGVSLGGKFISKRGFIGEIHAGIGRNMFDKNAPEVIGRGSVSFGYRF